MKHSREINDRPVHILFIAIALALLGLLAYALLLVAVQSQLNTTTAAPEPTRSSCWRVPYQLDQPSELVCALRLPTQG